MGHFIVNKEEILGTFHCLDVDLLFEPSHVFIGGRLNSKNALEKTLDRYISSVEIYWALYFTRMI